jgi:hypothetical protein
VGVWIYKANEAKRGYPTGHCKCLRSFEGYLSIRFMSLTHLDTNFAMLLMVAFGCVGMRLYYAWRNRRGGAGDGLDFKY